jgi:hypothetical protein
MPTMGKLNTVAFSLSTAHGGSWKSFIRTAKNYKSQKSLSMSGNYSVCLRLFGQFRSPRGYLIDVRFDQLRRRRSLSSNEETFFEKSLSLYFALSERDTAAGLIVRART